VERKQAKEGGIKWKGRAEPAKVKVKVKVTLSRRWWREERIERENF
jgi:hypothetical protein